MTSVLRENCSESNTRSNLFLLIVLVVFGIVLIRTAWVCDDAYIALRVSDNLVHGNGLTWNIDERVQAFTSPLWVLTMAGVHGVVGDMYYAVIFFSILLALATVALVWLKLARRRSHALLLVLLLLFSKAFIDYSSSGLENVQIHLLLISFALVLLAEGEQRRTIFLLALLTSLTMVTRIDAGLLILPVLWWQFWKMRSLRSLGTVLAGFAPFIIWELFSLYYYGFPFPNTYYAKLHTGIPQSELLVQSFMYYLDAVQFDPLTIATIAVAIGAGLWSKNYRLIGLTCGLLLYLTYTVTVGCDFMLGRFLTAPLICGVIIISQIRLPDRWMTILPACAAVILIGIASPRCSVLTGDNFGKSAEGAIDARGIADERGWYYQSTGLLRAGRGVTMPNHEWTQHGLEMKWKGDSPVSKSCVGFAGYFAGPKIHVVDGFALTEPLFARLPIADRDSWRIGHFSRTAPAGYVKSLAQHKGLIVDSGTATYVSYLQIVTRGPLLSWQRLKHIVNFNLGRYDTLLRYYLQPSVLKLTYSQVNGPKAQGTPWNAKGVFALTPGGMSVALDTIRHDSLLEISIDHNDMCVVAYFREGHEIDHSSIAAKSIESGGLRVDTVVVPRPARLQGYDRIDARPCGGDDLYSIGHLRVINDTSKS